MNEHNREYTPPHESQYQSFQTDTFITFLQKNALALTVQGVGLVVLIINLWLAAQLAPLAESIREVKAAQERTESKLDDNDDLVERFYVIEEKVKNIEKTVDGVASDVKLLLRQQITDN